MNAICVACGEPLNGRVAKNRKCRRCKRAQFNETRHKRRTSIGKKCPDCGRPIYDSATYCQRHAAAHRKPGGSHKAYLTKLRNGCYLPIGTESMGKDGYVMIKVRHGCSHKTSDGFYGNYKFKHRWVMEQCLGRSLEHNETVHHIDGNKTNNAPDNLLLLKNSQHNKLNHFLALLNESDEETKRKIILTLRIRHGELFNHETTSVSGLVNVNPTA